MRMGENGGIENDDYITHPEDFTRSYGSRDIPTILSENWNRNEDQTYYLTHRYNLGFYKDIELPDSLRPVMPADSVLLKGLRDSLLTVYQKADTAYQHAVMDSLRNDFMAKQDNPQDFIPVTSFIHTLRIRNAKHTVYSYDTPDHYYADLFYGDPNNMSDRTRGYSIQNTLGIALREGFNKWAKAGLTAFASHEYRHYTMPDLNGGNKIIRSYSENNISVGGQLSKREGKTLHYDVTGEVTLLGEDVGQFDVEGRADLNFRLFKDTVQLAARAFVKNLNPSFYMRHYHSQFAWWDNDLNKEFRTRIEGTLSLKRTRTALTVGVENIKNYAYFATDKIAYNDEGGQFAGYSNRISVKQYGGSVQVFSARLNQNFKFGILHWDNEGSVPENQQSGHPPPARPFGLQQPLHRIPYCQGLACAVRRRCALFHGILCSGLCPHHPTVYGSVAGNADEVRQLSHLQRLRQPLPEALPFLCERKPCKQRNGKQERIPRPPLSHQSDEHPFRTLVELLQLILDKRQ